MELHHSSAAAALRANTKNGGSTSASLLVFSILQLALSMESEMDQFMHDVLHPEPDFYAPVTSGQSIAEYVAAGFPAVPRRMVGPGDDPGPPIKDHIASARYDMPGGNLRPLVCTLISGKSITQAEISISDVYVQCDFPILVVTYQCDGTSGIHGEAKGEQHQRQATAEFSHPVV